MAKFKSFVILAAMRTGSNFLESSLNAVPGVTSHGEAFNLSFIGFPDQPDILGITHDARNARPTQLLDRIANAPGLNGFRYFPGHDPRVLPLILSDPHCAKIILTRSPIESYVSLMIARETDQWRLGDVRGRKSARIHFDADEFKTYLNQLQTFQHTVRSGLQSAGQTAFYLDYEDLNDSAVLQGLLNFLGVTEKVAPAKTIVPQNPESLAEKVTNLAEMEAALHNLAPFDLSRIRNFEPRRGPAVPGFVATASAPILFMPIEGGPSGQIENWLAGFGSRTLLRDFTQATLRDWMRKQGATRRFTVLRHPLLRAFAAFEKFVLGDADRDLRGLLARHYKVEVKEPSQADDLRAGFEAFLKFLKPNLNGQTAARVDASWATQTAVVQGFQQFAPCDLLAREGELARDLANMCAGIGLSCPPLADAPDLCAARLATIYDRDMEKLARQAYARDFLNFGFVDWA